MNRMIFRVVLILSFIIFGPVAEAQSIAPDRDGTDPAILVRGPVKSIGFPLLYPNAIETWLGYYRYLDLEVVVSFTREDILLPDEWESAVCAGIKGFTPDGLSFFYKDDDWSLLFQFQDPIKASLEGIPIDNVRVPLAGTLPKDQCTFINKFITRLKYFLRNADPDAPPLLPAILEF